MDSRPQKAVGLFGYYGRHNYGDDLMAALFAKAIVDSGARCVVYGLDSEFECRFGVRTTRSIDELVSNCQLVVYGGGGALLPQPAGHAFSQTIGALVDSCERNSVPLACLSIGGNGLPLREVTPPSRRRLVEYASLVTARDPNDALMLRDAGIRAEFYHDIVWTSGATFQQKSDNRGQTRIAVNLYPHDLLRQDLDRVFAAMAHDTTDAQWTFVETHTFPPEYRQAYCPNVTCERFQRGHFHDVESGLNFLANCDLVVTSRLHVGVAAMSLGIPCLALAPEAKTSNCFALLGLTASCWNVCEAAKLRELDKPQGRADLRAAFERVDRAGVSKSANHHLTRLREIIEGL